MSPSFTSLLRSYALFHAHATNSQQVDLRAQTKVTIGSLKKAILAAPGSHEKTQAVYAITSFLHEVSEGGEANDQELESLVASEFQQAMGGSSEKWPLLSDALADDGVFGWSLLASVETDVRQERYCLPPLAKPSLPK